MLNKHNIQAEFRPTNANLNFRNGMPQYLQVYDRKYFLLQFLYFLFPYLSQTQGLYHVS